MDTLFRFKDDSLPLVAEKIIPCFYDDANICVQTYWLKVPMSENTKLMSSGSSHHYLECIKAAYEFSSSELLNLIKEKV